MDDKRWIDKNKKTVMLNSSSGCDVDQQERPIL